MPRRATLAPGVRLSREGGPPHPYGARVSYLWARSRIELCLRKGYVFVKNIDIDLRGVVLQGAEHLGQEGADRPRSNQLAGWDYSL